LNMFDSITACGVIDERLDVLAAGNMAASIKRLKPGHHDSHQRVIPQP